MEALSAKRNELHERVAAEFFDRVVVVLLALLFSRRHVFPDARERFAGIDIPSSNDRLAVTAVVPIWKDGDEVKISPLPSRGASSVQDKSRYHARHRVCDVRDPCLLE